MTTTLWILFVVVHLSCIMVAGCVALEGIYEMIDDFMSSGRTHPMDAPLEHPVLFNPVVRTILIVVLPELTVLVFAALVILGVLYIAGICIKDFIVDPIRDVLPRRSKAQ